VIASVRACKGCGEWGLCWDGYCGDCAPVPAVASYVAWWNEHGGDLPVMPIGFFDEVVGRVGQGEDLDEQEKV
jgi:hypothetical protein